MFKHTHGEMRLPDTTPCMLINLRELLYKGRMSDMPVACPENVSLWLKYLQLFDSMGMMTDHFRDYIHDAVAASLLNRVPEESELAYYVETVNFLLATDSPLNSELTLAILLHLLMAPKNESSLEQLAWPSEAFEFMPANLCVRGRKCPTHRCLLFSSLLQPTVNDDSPPRDVYACSNPSTPVCDATAVA